MHVAPIEVSPHDPATAYLAVTRYKLEDYRPYAYRTDDYGSTWTAIVDGIPEGAWVRVVEDPRIDTTGRDYAEQQALLAEIRAALNELHDSVLRARTVTSQVEAEVARAGDLSENEAGPEAIEEAGRELIEALEEWEGTVVQTKTETFQDVINFPNLLNAQIAFLFGAVDEADPPVTEGARTRWQTLEAEWHERRAALQQILDEQVPAFNALVEEHQVPAVVVPPEGKHLEPER